MAARAAVIAVRAACALVPAVAPAAGAQDTLEGKRLYHDVGRLRGTGVSCVDCHGGLPGALHGLPKAADRPAAIDYAINAIPQMAPLRGRLSPVDLANLAAYIARPAAASPDLRIATAGPAHSPWSTERLEFTAPVGASGTAPSSISFANAGTLPLQLQSAPKVDGPNAREFAIVESDCFSGTTLSKDQSCRIVVEFRPLGPAGLRSASVGIEHDWILGAAHVALIGRVTDRPQRARQARAATLKDGRQGGEFPVHAPKPPQRAGQRD
jgi:mono/diheme cytochrome c family protein